MSGSNVCPYSAWHFVDLTRVYSFMVRVDVTFCAQQLLVDLAECRRGGAAWLGMSTCVSASPDDCSLLLSLGLVTFLQGRNCQPQKFVLGKDRGQASRSVGEGCVALGWELIQGLGLWR